MCKDVNMQTNVCRSLKITGVLVYVLGVFVYIQTDANRSEQVSGSSKQSFTVNNDVIDQMLKVLGNSPPPSVRSLQPFIRDQPSHQEHFAGAKI